MSKTVQLTKPERALWQRMGQGFSQDIFDRFDSFEEAMDGALADLAAADLARLRQLIESKLASGDDARALWEASGAEIAFGHPKGARMALMMLLEAVKARG
ncbi:hypothetical protein [Sagittula sp. SSi028]|uniref:hypothetical protein n=1 Tax=Sagittula sp. SSi028 TaxID=3400636 RepID=UPI003AF614D8